MPGNGEVSTVEMDLCLISPFPLHYYLEPLRLYIDCLNIIISRGLDATYNDFLLLKESTATKNIDMFRQMLCISSDRNPIPIIVMKDILLLAIKHDNVPLVDHLLSLKIKYGLKF